MKRVMVSTVAAAVLMVGGAAVTATTAAAAAPATAIDTTSTGSANTILAGKLGCVLGSLFGAKLPNC